LCSSGYLDVSVRRVDPPTQSEYPPDGGWVAPFGYLRIWAKMQLPAAFRSLTRPSSPACASAFTIRPYLLCTYMTCTPRLPARRPSMSVSLLYKIMCHSSQNDLDRSISYQLSLCQRTGPSSPMVSSPAG